MSLRGLDSYITGHWGDDYWGNKYDEYYGTFICGFCIASDHKHCVSKHCGCPYRSPGDRTRMGREHQRKRGKLALVMDQASQRYAWDDPSWNETEDDTPLIPQGYKITGTMTVVKDEADGDEGIQPGPQVDNNQPVRKEGAGLASKRNDNGDTDE